MSLNSTFDERLVLSDAAESNIIYNEHLIRYNMAAELVKGKVILDIACGSGYGSKILAEAGAAKVIAIDGSAEAIKEAEKNFSHNNIEYKTGDAVQIAVNDKTIDIAVSFETIEHLNGAEKFLSELERVVKSDGLAIISTPNKKVSKEKNPFHIREYDKEEFDAILKKYFPHCVIVNQYNGLASFLKIDSSDNGKIIITNKAEPIFFIAVCSKSELPFLPISNSISANPVALNNLYNNPGLKIINKIYSILVKIPGGKSFFKKIR